MHDVARRAGVSVKTVSNVVNDYLFVRDSTRAKVLAAIDEEAGPNGYAEVVVPSRLVERESSAPDSLP